ncbi:MAG TPA: crosslink repair DNA glycosylase YcaQ family protein [Acidimicrobiales bacterium]|nr:crosslink repair DNA glycosylase YcaQ family protein [Acidimicrobiales bacterium]
MRGPPDGVSNAAARRIALAAQGFTDPPPSGRSDLRHVRRALGRVGVLQIDSVNVLVRSHELPLFSRLGPYPRTALMDLTERRRELFEYWGHMASLVPVRFHPLLRWRMERAKTRAFRLVARMQRDRPGYVESVLAEVAERGPIAASDLTDPGTKRGPWWGWAYGKSVLEWLFYTGDVAASGRGRNFERLYDIPTRVLPADVLAAPTPTVEDAQRSLLLESARCLGIATARDIADYFRIGVTEARPRLAELVETGDLIPTRVEGWKQAAFLHSSARVPRRVHARALLSPFDSLVWDRDRTERLFGMRYRIELYTPAPKRVHGYYVLPFLLDDRLVARVDVKADRKHSTLQMLGAHVEDADTDSAGVRVIAGELDAELRSMADWLALEHVEPKRVRF